MYEIDRLATVLLLFGRHVNRSFATKYTKMINGWLLVEPSLEQCILLHLCRWTAVSNVDGCRNRLSLELQTKVGLVKYSSCQIKNGL